MAYSKEERKLFLAWGIVVIAFLVFLVAFMIGMNTGVKSGMQSHSATMIEMKKALKDRYIYCPYCGHELHYYYDYPYREGAIDGVE